MVKGEWNNRIDKKDVMKMLIRVFGCPLARVTGTPEEPFIKYERIMRVSMGKTEELEQNETSKNVRITPYKNL